MCDERHSYDEEEIGTSPAASSNERVWAVGGRLGRESGRSTEELEVGRRSVTLVRDRVVVRRAEPAVVAARAFKAGRSESGPVLARACASRAARLATASGRAREVREGSFERNHYRYPGRNTVPFSARLLCCSCRTGVAFR